MFRPLLIVAVVLAIAGTARADVPLFSAGFEASEGYSTGQLAGQNGWILIGENSSISAGQTAYWDDVSVAAIGAPPGTPLPPTVILTLTGVGLVGFDRTRRKFAAFGR